MAFRRIINQLLVCLLIPSLLASSASASGYVWCVSAEGDHSVLEFAPTGDCSVDDCVSTTASIATPGFEADTDGCGPCLDISSSYQWNVSRCRQGDIPADIPADLLLAVLDVFNLLPDRTLNPYRLVDPPPRSPDPLLHHRTIVLLI